RRRHTRFSRDWSSDVCSSDLNQPIPDVIEAMVMRLLAKDPDKRQQTATDVRLALKSANLLPLDLPSSVLPVVSMAAAPLDEPTVDGPAIEDAIAEARSGEADVVRETEQEDDATKKRRSLLSLPRITPLRRGEEKRPASWLAVNGIWAV